MYLVNGNGICDKTTDFLKRFNEASLGKRTADFTPSRRSLNPFHVIGVFFLPLVF